MDSRQFCSVCKQWLDMEVVPTADGDDDGVVWFRCPQCQGFLPKLSSAVAGPAADPDGAEPESGADEAPQPRDGAAPGIDGARSRRSPARRPDAGDDDDGDTGGSLADDELVPDDDGDEPVAIDEDADVDGDAKPGPGGPGASAEPVLEYAARLAAADPETAVPYRPWDSYEVGQCVLHLAWNDCGIVVAKEALPGGRRIIKCWFQGAGVVRLIENTPQ